jgi:replicative DNA helicase
LYEKREPADLVTVPAYLKKRKKLEDIGGVTYLTELVNYVHTASNIEFYGKEIRNYSLRRQLMSTASKIGELSLQGTDVDELLDQAEQLLFSVSQIPFTRILFLLKIY